jgi:hypothetical protein
MSYRFASLALSGLLVGCSTTPSEPDDDDSVDETPAPGAWESLDCVADDDSLRVALNEPAPLQLRAWGARVDGDPVDASPDAVWTVLRGGGTVAEDGLYTAAGDRGGLVTVRAELEGLTAVCTLEVHLDVWVDLAETGMDPVQLHEAEVRPDDRCGAYVAYPGLDAAFPPNQIPPEIHWRPAADHDIYIVDLQSEYVHVRAAVDGRQWEPPANMLEVMSRSHNGQRVDVLVRVLTGTYDAEQAQFEGILCTADRRIEIEISDLPLVAAVYYWSEATDGLWSIDVGTTDPVRVLDSDTTGECVGCHSSNHGRPQDLTMTWGDLAVVAQVSDISTPIVGPNEERPARFTAINGDGTRLVRSWGGSLHLDDLSTGESLGVLPTIGYATHPSYAPDGARVVYTSCASGEPSDWYLTNCGLRVLETDDFGELTREREVVPRDPIWNYYYPSISPNGDWVVFNRSMGHTHSNDDAELMVIPLTRQGGPIRLDRANGGVNLANSWPRWGPMRGNEAWLTFSSRRGYGEGGGGASQIWLAELDMSLARQHFDPSRAPIRLSGQEFGVGHYTPTLVRLD